MHAKPRQSPWSRGRLSSGRASPELLFGRMHEDWAIEASTFTPGGRILCIGSAGCTALALSARGFVVDAVDINPKQVEYVHARMANGYTQRGVVEQGLTTIRRLFSLLGFTRSSLLSFLLLKNTVAQLDYWKKHLNNRRLQLLVRLLLSPMALRRHYDTEFLNALPPQFATTMLGRLQRGWQTHINAYNPYAWQLLLGEDPPDSHVPKEHPSALSMHCNDVLQYLKSAPTGTYAGFSLSNILDGASAEYASALLDAVAMSAAPNAIIVLRSFGNPLTPQQDFRAKMDRSLIWGRIHVARVSVAKQEIINAHVQSPTQEVVKC